MLEIKVGTLDDEVKQLDSLPELADGESVTVRW
jgi:hypothetical protein